MFQATPTLVVGIGGTGLKVATYIKKNLWEANQNELPQQMDILVLDTEGNVRYQAGGWGQERSQRHSTGPVKIDVGEYIALTGTVLEWGKQIKNEQLRAEANPASLRSLPLRHMSAWFQARYYLDVANIDPSVWNLDVGAGRYRQFGRLAFFNRLDDVKTKVKSALEAIKRMGANQLYVHVTGSLSGGTGAALFVDTAHIIRQIARDVGFGQEPVLFGHFVLPEGFRGTKQVNLAEPGVKSEFYGRAYAALREMTRLQGPVVARTGGYPLIYDPHGTGELRASLQNKLYSAVYLYDGIRGQNPLNSLPLENGLAPAIADAITAYIDDRSGGAFCAHSVNYQAFYNAYNIPTGAVTYGSIGTYTIELPIYHITEGWTHELARQALAKLLAPDPDSIDRDTSVPGQLLTDQPGGRPVDPQNEAANWLKEATTTLVSRLADWGRQAQRGETLERQAKEAILALNAESWQQQLAPSDARLQDYVNEAQAELQGKLTDIESHKYYVDHNQPGDSKEQKASNLQQEVDNKLRLMIGEIQDVWRRSGGDFRGALVRLGNHHVRAFEESLINWLKEHLNGGADVGNAEEKKAGKLGFVRAFLESLESTLANSAQVLEKAEKDSRSKRRPQFNVIETERKESANNMQRRSGFMGRNLRTYRQKSDELAQFHKADIARQVVYDLAKRLHQSVRHLLNEVHLWERILATSTANNGGTYALVMRGKREVDIDREKSKNAVRWVIDDSEPGDEYIGLKYERYARGQLSQILEKVQWRVGRLDGTGDLRIDFALGDGQPWSRQAGQAGQQRAGESNANQLLALCRAVFEQAWGDMSVTAYLKQNYYEQQDRVDELAGRIHQSSGYLLSRASGKNLPTMRTTFVRVYQERMDTRSNDFLRDLRQAVAKLFQETSNAQQRATAAGEDYVSLTGENSRDPFKLTFVLFGDLLLPEEIAGYQDAETEYHSFSGTRDNWRELQILPAETNALQIEKDLDRGSDPGSQRRRELDDEVVTVLEDIGLFHLAMHCLAYGETDYFWSEGNERGLLLHRYTPLKDNQAGYSYWRLTVQPEGIRAADGGVYDSSGRLARPLHYQLTEMAAEPDLLQAFIQFVSVGRDRRNQTSIDWERIEATVQQAVSQHRSRWAERSDLGWHLLPGKDKRLEAELLDKATCVIRLNAFMASLDEVLTRHRWAWAKEVTEPPAQIRNQQSLVNNIRRQVDLHTALRGLAQREMENLTQRLQALGSRTGATPTEMVTLNSNIPVSAEVKVMTAVEVLPELDDGWLCSRGHQNRAEDLFCSECGERRPEPAKGEKIGEEEIVSKQARTEPHDPEIEKKLDLLKQNLEMGLMTQQEYEEKITAILAVDRPIDLETERKLDLLKQNLEVGLMTQEEYEAKVAQFLGQ
jgi:hypothetical protein